MYCIVLQCGWTDGQEVLAVCVAKSKKEVMQVGCFDPYNQYYFDVTQLELVGSRTIADCKFGKSYPADVYKVR